jgi:hypothetical protein
MALGSTQPLVKMRTRNIPGGKGGRCVRLTTSPPSYAECHENLGASGPRRACNGTTLPFTFYYPFAVNTFVADNTRIVPTISVREQSTLKSLYVPRSCNAGMDDERACSFLMPTVCSTRTF